MILHKISPNKLLSLGMDERLYLTLAAIQTIDL
jgi:hypothetical protein